MRDFKKLRVWERGHHLALAIYRVRGNFPAHEMYGLTSQLRRAAVSIPSNIAEGCGRHGQSECGRFLHIAAGSASEMEYHLMLAHELRYLGSSDFNALVGQVTEVKQMLTVLLRKLKAES